MSELKKGSERRGGVGQRPAGPKPAIRPEPLQSEGISQIEERVRLSVSLAHVQRIQDQIHDIYISGEMNLQDKNPAAFYAGLLAWEATRLFWYALRGDRVGMGEKLGYVKEAMERLEQRWITGDVKKT